MKQAAAPSNRCGVNTRAVTCRRLARSCRAALPHVVTHMGAGRLPDAAATEQLLLGVGTAPQALTPSCDGGSPGSTAAPAPAVPQLVDLVRPGPTGTIASTAAAATAAHAVCLHTGPCVAPVGLLSACAATQRQQAQQAARPISTVMQDLMRAADKALASGLGDWHLQRVQDISPHFEQHVLLGALGPEALKHQHGLQEPQILHLYGLLHRHCTGFQQEVAAALAGAAHREQLLAAVWMAFAQLWDECTQASFQGDVQAAIQELQGTHQCLLDTQDSLAAAQDENATLTARCREFVRANLDHMLAWRSLKAQADALQGEVAMLSAANSEISLRAAAVSARNTQLTVQLEGLGARLVGAEQQIQQREAALCTARAALLEKDSGLRRLECQVAVLEQQVVAGQQGTSQLDSSIRELRVQLQARDQAVQDAERRVADKQRAFNLLHADFAKQKAEVVEAEQRVQQLHTQLQGLQQQLAAAQQEAAKAHRWRLRWEVAQMHVEDLAATNARAAQRRHEVVSSYWPLMRRLNQAEDVVAALSKQVVESGQQPAAQLPLRDSRAQEVSTAHVDVSPAPPSSSSSSSTTTTPPPAAAAPAQTTGRASSSSQQQQEQHAPAEAAVRGDDAASAPALLSPAAAAHDELQELCSSYALVQDECWQQKKQLLALEVETGRLQAAAQAAEDAAAQAASALSDAQRAAAKEAAERSRLEADLVGCRSWIRELEKTEQQYLCTIRQQGALEQAAVHAERQADDLRAALAAANTDLRLAQAAGAAAARERDALLVKLTSEAQRSTLVEQALQRVHMQQVASGRAERSQLQQRLEQEAEQVQRLRTQLDDVHAQHDAAIKQQQQALQQLQQAQHRKGQLQQRLSEAWKVMQDMLQRLEGMQSRVSFVSSQPAGADGGCETSSSTTNVAMAVEAALHLLERLMVLLQCLSADAATIANAAAAHKVEVLVGSLFAALQSAAAAATTAAGKQAAQAQPVSALAASAGGLVMLRNAAAAAGQQRSKELEQQLASLQLQHADVAAQLSAALSANARLQRSLRLKERAAASLQRQLLAAEQQLQAAAAAQAASGGAIAQLEQHLSALRLQQAQLSAKHTACAGELSAACSRASGAEAAVEQLQASAAAAEASGLELTAQLSQAMAASRQDAADAEAARAGAAAAALQAEQLAQQLEAALQRAAALEAEVKECRHKADMCQLAARDAQFRAVQTATLLADARREVDFMQHMQEHQQKDKVAVA